MKKVLFKTLPLILLFVFVFSVPVSAEEAPVYCGEINEENHVYIYNCEWFRRPSGVTNWTCIDGMKYRYVSTGANDKIALYESVSSTSYEPEYGKTLNCPYPQDSRYQGQCYETFNGTDSDKGSNYLTIVRPRLYQWQTSSTGDNHTVKFETNIPIFATQDECTQYLSGLIGVEQAINYMKVYDCETERWVPVNIKNPDEGSDHIFDFDILEDFENFVEQSSEYNDIAQKQDLVDSTSNPNDGIFLSILQAISGLVHTGNSITQQISNQIQNFVDQFFNNFAQNALGLLSEIKDSLGNILPENLTSMIDQLYESGLDADGNFGIGTMLDYWFVPDMDAIKRSYDDTIGQINSFDVVTDTMLGFISSIQEVEPVAPIFTIPATSFSYSPSSETTVSYELPEYKISFEWFEAWKPFTDPLITAFVYITFFWHLFKQIPGIISGTAATTASAGYYNDASIKAMNKKAKGG